MNERSIFKEFYTDVEFVDRFETDKDNAVDVIIPIIHTNELWEINLKSIYREIPVNRILISDGGCIDNSLEVLEDFPRVTIFDHKDFKSLGFCIKKLIESVETEWFIYPHSDVYLPDGWFDKMSAHKTEYDWFGCKMRHTVMVEYDEVNNFRPYAGSQMGRKDAFIKGLKKIDDDYIYRQEDFVFKKVVEDSGFKEGKIDDTFHYHQTMPRRTIGFDFDVKKVSIEVNRKKDEDIRAADSQVKGIIKYLEPSDKFAEWAFTPIVTLRRYKQLKWSDFKSWIIVNNKEWLKYFNYWRLNYVKYKIKNIIKGASA